MAEAVLLAVSKIGAVLGEKAIKIITARWTNLNQLPGNLKYIEKELRTMHNLILDLDTTNLRINVIKGWVGELRKLAFRVEDAMDKYSYHAVQLKEEGTVMKFLKGSHYAMVFSEVAEEVVSIKTEIEQVKKQQSEWSHMVQFAPKSFAAIDRWGSQGSYPTLVQDEDLVGINENRIKLLEWLDSNDQPENRVITVSGMGGLGKSSLVANVYDRVKNSFGITAWIAVSQTCTIEGLLSELLWKIAHIMTQSSANVDIHELKQQIRTKLQTSVKSLIVLDDVWDTEVYTKIQDIFKNLQSSCVIITTRKEDVASLASSGHHLQLQPLGTTDALQLFYARAFSNTVDQKCPPELEDLAGKIVARCKGLPLAIVSMASLMSSKQPTEHAWNQVYNQFRSELTKGDDVQAILKLSYNNLPGNLRNCFLYCSLFPEDYTMSRESLVRQWVAEGFAVKKENNTPEDVAELYLVDLIARNMLQVVDYDELGRVSTCKMHDIVRDLALSTAKEEKFGSANDQGEMIQIDRGLRRLSSCGWRDTDDSSIASFPHLRTLMSLDAVTSTTRMLGSIFSGSCYLTVLEMQDSAIIELPASVENLFNLRYIGLRRTRVKSLPECIEKLSNLQTLDIKQTRIEKLPRGIVKLKKLRHLLADKVIDEKQQNFQYFIGVQPPKELSNLEELQTLETVEANDHLADQLAKMKKLQSVWIGSVGTAHSAKLFTTLSDMPLLSSLLLNAIDENQELCLEALSPKSKQLHRLIIRGRWAAGMLKCPVFQGHGKALKYLALSWSGLQEDDPLSLLAPHVPNLVYLSLNRVSNVETLVVSEGCFPRLKTLVLKNLANVNQLTIGKDSLKNIEGLYIMALPQLDKVPENIENLNTLKRLWLLYLHRDFKDQWQINGMHQKMGYVLEVKI